ncbi:DUF6716 putative glycosyltransferase [Mariniluteicoccus flavus]
MRIVSVCDSDSYLKWAASLLEDVPASWRVRHTVVTNVLEPSDAQVEAVRGGWPIERRTALGLARFLRRERPDVVLLSATGPAIEAVMEVLHETGALAHRPVLATGLPGISFPANDLAVHHRRDCDLFVLHSRREVAAYAAVVAARGGAGPAIGLATLPYLQRIAPSAGGRDVVFAAQALVPVDLVDRRRVLAALESLPSEFNPVVKVRALAGERQAHNEDHPYAGLWAARPHSREIEFRAGAMRDALARAHGFVTVSSTAAIEAIAAGVPSLVLGDFGVDAATINLVFEGSGLIGDLDDLAGARFRTPDPAWLDANYFHDPAADDWRERLESLVAQRSTLPTIAFRPSGGPIARARRLARLVPRGWQSTATSAARRLRPGR